MNSMSFNRLAAFAGLGAVTAAGLSGCFPAHHGHHAHGGRPMVVSAQLECPQFQGALKRVSVTPDGQSCEYRRNDGEQVTLTRMALNGQDPRAALAPIEGSLKTLIPPRGDGPPAPPPPPGSTDTDSARIDVPGVHIDAHGDKAEVRVFGVTIDADNEKANVHAGSRSHGAVVSADDHGAEIRATDIDANNASLVLVLASEKPGPTGLRAVGYMARGPVAGPLVVAQFKSTDHQTGFSDDHDIKRLLDVNVTR